MHHDCNYPQTPTNAHNLYKITSTYMSCPIRFSNKSASSGRH